MPKIDALLTSLGTGWKVTGTGTPVEEVTTIPNPMASNPVAPANTPSTITQGTGRYYVVVQDPDGHQRAMFLTPSTDQGVSGPGLTPSPAITGKADGTKEAPAAPGTRVVAGNELAGLNWEQAGALADVPAGSTTKQPSATTQLDAIDAKGNVVPQGDPSAKQLRDPVTGTTINLVTDAAGTLHDLGNDVILVKPDGSYTKVATKPKEASQFQVTGVGLVEYDPSKPADQQYTVKVATPDKPAPTTEVRNGVTWQYDPATKDWTQTNLPVQQTDIGYTLNDPNSDQIVFYDKQGKEVSRTTKPNWKAPVQVQPGTAPAADLVSPNIPTFNPQTGALEFTPNQNQVKASEATSGLAKQLGVKVAAGSMSEKQAQDIITGAINTMNAQTSRMTAEANQQQNVTTAAGDVLANVRGNAQTGAGLLQQRVQAATGTLQSILGNALSNKNITSVPGDVGANLVQGLQGWTADLMGGQGTLDSAARMVQMADPKSDMADPTTQAAIATLKQMLDKHQELTGAPHPIVQATQAANASQANGGMQAPATVTQPVQIAGPGVSMTPNMINMTQMPGFGGGGQSTPMPNFAVQNAQAAGAGVGGMFAPWQAQPGMPSFVAPAAPVPLAARTL